MHAGKRLRGRGRSVSSRTRLNKQFASAFFSDTCCALPRSFIASLLCALPNAAGDRIYERRKQQHFHGSSSRKWRVAVEARVPRAGAGGVPPPYCFGCAGVCGSVCRERSGGTPEAPAGGTPAATRRQSHSEVPSEGDRHSKFHSRATHRVTKKTCSPPRWFPGVGK